MQLHFEKNHFAAMWLMDCIGEREKWKRPVKTCVVVQEKDDDGLE